MTRLPACLAVVAVLLTLAGAGTSIALDWDSAVDVVFGVAFALVGVGSAITGAVVASRVRANPVGWIILGLGLGVGVLLFAGAYGELGTGTDSGPLPGGDVAAWLGDVSSIALFFGLSGFLLLLFPTGHLLTARWRPFAWTLAALIAVATVSYGLAPGNVAQGVPNPFALGGRAGGVVKEVDRVTDLLALPTMLTCAVAIILRLHRARGVERQQLKWFAFVAAVAGAGLGATVLSRGLFSEIVFGAGLLGVAAMPETAGLAILRHGLYGIDVVIKRTLVYGPLTAALVGTYLLLVLVLQPVLRPLAGESDLAVAASTLAVAAMFRPLRARIQSIVDRRFYRARYDAARTVEGFAAHLRDELDLETLGTYLRAVVRVTMQPAHLSLWLRESRVAL
ncbi:MAG: hypothetical protein M3Q87_11300 [Actinomycetota bacterium]|nr:hypothetical protein [Actinomycetota bacterium]